MSPATGPSGQPEPAPVRPSDGSAHLPSWSPEPDPTAFPPESPPEPAPEPAPAVVVPPAPSPANDRGCHGSSQCRRLIGLGAVAGGLGLGTIVAGAVLVTWRPEVDPDDPTTLLTYRPPGAAILAIGSGLVATSLLTLLAARRASQQALRRQRRAALEAVP